VRAVNSKTLSTAEDAEDVGLFNLIPAAAISPAAVSALLRRSIDSKKPQSADKCTNVGCENGLKASVPSVSSVVERLDRRLVEECDRV